MTFKNDKERIEFLGAYKDDANPYAANWSIWKHDDILGRRWWTTHVGVTIFIVEEEYITISWPTPHKSWSTRQWYIYEGPEMKDSFSQEVTFGDRRASRTMALARMKEIEKEAKHLTGLLMVTEPEHDPAEPVVETTIEMYGINAEAVPLDLDYVEHVCDVCMSYELDPAILFAMMWQESRFTPDAVGDHGQSFGILQIKRKWHEDRIQRLGVTDLFDEWQEIYVACDYLAEIREDYPNITQMLTVYRYGDLNVTGEDYAGTVLAKAEEYRK